MFVLLLFHDSSMVYGMTGGVRVGVCDWHRGLSGQHHDGAWCGVRMMS